MKRITSVKIFVLMAVFGLLFTNNVVAQAAGGLEIYTSYTKISVSPGKSVSYSIDVINNGEQTRNEDIFVSGIPGKWEHSLSMSGYDLKRLAILPNDKKTISLKVEVPYQVRKGNYTFYIKAGEASLPLSINVSSAGSSESELTCDQKNMEGTSKSTFNFKAVLKNKTANDQQYALIANAPRGWEVAIKPKMKQATSTEVEANSSKDITYEIKPPTTVKAGTYKIPVKAVAGSTSAELELEVVVTGSYDVSVGTPNGLLSAKMTAGQEKKIELNVKNTGSAKLEGIQLKDSKPKNWELTFEPTKIESLEPGKTEKVYATIKADKKAIPGDYVAKITAKTSEASSDISFRVTVKTPILMGWLGILIIVLAIGGVLFLFKKYGRR